MHSIQCLGIWHEGVNSSVPPRDWSVITAVESFALPFISSVSTLPLCEVNVAMALLPITVLLIHVSIAPIDISDLASPDSGSFAVPGCLRACTQTYISRCS